MAPRHWRRGPRCMLTIIGQHGQHFCGAMGNMIGATISANLSVTVNKLLLYHIITIFSYYTSVICDARSYVRSVASSPCS